MLIQYRADALRLIRQHDHGALAGRIAAAWRDDGPDGRARMATAWHDAVWTPEDREPRFDPVAREPYSFETLPDHRKAPMVEDGLTHLAALDPDVAALVREHHEALAGQRPPHGDARWVRFFDLFSLRLCLAPPAADPLRLPPWLERAELRAPHAGASLRLEWRDEVTVAVAPWPFRGTGPVRLDLPCRDLPRRAYDSQAELTAAWRRAEARIEPLELIPGENDGPIV